MSRKLRVGIIGLGRISVMHLASASMLKQAEIVAVCDIKEELAKAAAEKYSAAAYSDYKKMIEEVGLDAVHICTPHYLHTEMAEYAFSKGVNVLSEKPMSIDVASAEHCIATAEKYGKLYGVILQCRYNASSQLIKRALESGKLGKIISARSTLTWSRPDSYYEESDWKGTWDKEGGGVMIDQAIHSMDLVNWFIDCAPASISAGIANRGHKSVKVEDSAEGLITYKNGVKYGFYCMNNYGCDEPIEIRLYCEKGKAVMTYDDAEIRYDDGSVEKAEASEEATDYVSGAKDYWGFRHKKQIEQFYNACLGKEELEISGKDALAVQKIICAVYDAANRLR